MKKMLYLSLASLLAMSLQACTEEQDNHTKKEKVQFTFNLASIDDAGGRIHVADLPEGASLRISINKSSGAPVLSNHEIVLMKLGDGYITEPLELHPGRYVIIDFMIVKDAEVLYASPKRGSPLAAAVGNPVPYSFAVSHNKISQVDMEVIDVAKKQPEAFGYVSFNIDVVNPVEIAVFIMKNGGISFTKAKMIILQGETLISSHTILPKINIIGLKGDPAKTYTLTVIKNGYTTFTKTFTYHELKQELAGKPLKVMLEPELKLTTAVLTDEDDYIIDLEGTGSITVVWPDGMQESHTLPASLGIRMPKGTGHVIQLSGDLETISRIRAFGYNTKISALSGMEHLTGVKSLQPGWVDLDVPLDLSANTKLELVDLFHVTLPEWLILPEEHYINSITLSLSDRLISSDEIDLLINNLYDNAVKRDIYDGMIALTGSDTPSANAVEKIRVLTDKYRWKIALNL